MRALSLNMQISSLAEAIEFCKLLSNTDAVPANDRGKPGNILAKLQAGAEIGVPPMQAIRHLYVIDGRVSLEVTLMLALVEASGLLEDKVVEWDDPEKKTSCTVTVQRKGRSRPCISTFGEKEARKAGLFDKRGGMYDKWDWRMYYNRAMGFALQDTFPDILRGIVTPEYLADAGVRVEQAGPGVIEGSAFDSELQQQITGEFDRLRLPPARRLVKLQTFKGREPELLVEM
jgi:hypothetical protein